MSGLIHLFKGKDDKSHLMTKLQRLETVRNSVEPEYNYLIIDDKNAFNQQNEDYIYYITKQFNDYKSEEETKYNSTSKIMNTFLEKTISKSEDLFSLSQNIAKQINKKENKNKIEKVLQPLIAKGKLNHNVYKKNCLLLGPKICETFGVILCYAYSKMSKYKVKDMKKLIQIRKNIISKKRDILRDFVNYCTHNNKNVNEGEFTSFCKDNKKNYEILPEVIFLINRFSFVTSVQIQLDKFTDSKLTAEDFLYTKLTILNIYWLLNSLNMVKFNFSCHSMEQTLYFRYQTKLSEKCNEIGESLKKNILIDDLSLYNNKWDFIHKFKLQEEREAFIIDSNQNIVTHKSLDFTAQKANYNFTNAMVDSKRNTLVNNVFVPKKNDQNTKTRIDIVKSNMNLYDLIIISLMSLNNTEDYINVEIIMNDCFIGEIILVFNKFYEMDFVSKDYNSFHVFDLLLYNKIMKQIEKFNLEINSLDAYTFDKLLNFLYYNSSITSLNLSLFTADIIYQPEFLYKIYEPFNKNIKKITDPPTYLFNDYKDVEEEILNFLSTYFIFYLSVLFEIIRKKKYLNELGFNFDIPSNIVNKENYMNAIFKFILNILFYVSESYIKKFCLLSPNTIIDSRKNLYIKDLINSINFNNNPLLDDLSIQMQFFQIVNINNFVTSRLKFLNIGDLDIPTLKLLTNNISSYNFNKKSCLKKLEIGLSSAIIDFSFELKKIFEKLFQIKIKNFVSLSLYTNLYIRDKYQYLYLMNIIDKNWISEYKIIFNSYSQMIVNENKNELNKIHYLIPHNLEKDLLEDKDILKMQKKNNSMIYTIDKNDDIYDDSYWCLKYMFDKVYTDNLKNDQRTKEMIYDILKYIYFIKTPKIFHTIINKDKNK